MYRVYREDNITYTHIIIQSTAFIFTPILGKDLCKNLLYTPHFDLEHFDMTITITIKYNNLIQATLIISVDWH